MSHSPLAPRSARRSALTPADGLSLSSADGLSLTPADGLHVLRFAAAFLWADLELAERERAFFHTLARELGVAPSVPLTELLRTPPAPDEVDPTRVPPALACTVRDVALRAIASDGHVDEREMAMFELLDDLLPEPPS
jgi:hypothetical protein